MASAEISSTGTIAYVWSGSQWIPISGDVDEQSIINSASAAAYSSATTYVDSEINSLTTTDIEEGSNLYFTNQRAIDAASATYILQSEEQNIINTASAAASSYTDSAISSLVDSAPDLLNTLNELAEALGDDENFASNIVSTISSASANAITESNNYTDQEILSASSSLISYTDQEISSLEVFSNIATSPSTQLITGDSNSDTLTFVAGENISISADSSTDSITINSTGEYTNVDSISYPDYIAFNASPSLTSASVGTIAWDSGEEGLSVQVNENINLTVGKEIYVLAYNGEGDTLEPGEVVMVNGAQGQRPQVIRAYNTSDATSARTFGMVAESIASGGEGIVITQGVIAGINTNDYNEGDILYLSASPGLVTTVKPQAPNHYVWVGVVLKKNYSSGRVYIKPQNGYELDEIHDVRITSIAEGDIIVWNSASSLWLNEPIQNYLNTASAAAYASASAYTDSASASLVNYTDGEITTLTGVIASASAQAISDANSYTDGEITTLTGVIASASAQAISDANSYTDGEVATAIVTASAAAAGYTDSEISSLTTSDIEEGTNLYFTNQRAIDSASATYILQTSEQAIINSASAAAVTSANSYTDSEVSSAIVTASAAAAGYTDSSITNLIDSAPGALNTLNELAAALGDDENFASTIVNTISSASANSISSANSYTDGEITTLTGVLASASAQAIVDANSYTDGEITTLTGVLSSASAQAILDANSYTDGEITTLSGVLASASAQAVADSNSYTDGEVATAIVTASAAAAGYTDSEINSLTTLDIEENTNLYYTNERSLNTASTALVHNNHNNITASYDSGEIILSATSSGSAYAIVNTENTEPTPVDGLLYFNPNTYIFSVAYGGSWFDLATGVARDLDGGSSISSFQSTIDGGDSSTSEFTYSYDGGTSN